MTKRLTILLFTLLFNFSVLSQERTFQLWNLNNLEVNLSEKTKIGVTEKIHFNPQSGSIDLKLGDISFKRILNSWFEAGAVGRILLIRKEDGWLQENRLMIFGNFSKDAGKIELEFSNRFEYRMYKTLADHFRYRQMLTAELPLFAGQWVSAYISEEGFVRFDNENVHLARLYAGTKLKCSNTFEMKLYYVLEKNKQADIWRTSDVIGMNLSIDL
ncbi:DUF2490 domain-containing protein [Mariniphaga sp.]|uniref:DUF2490 domain-containing protein n=1 Tax=Mariniphaga sp. TaxID=1954475 RepID=UPI00356ACDFE